MPETYFFKLNVCMFIISPNSDIVSGCLRSLIRAAVYFLVFASIFIFLNDSAAELL